MQSLRRRSPQTQLCGVAVRKKHSGGFTMERTEALELLQQYNKEPFHIQHAVTVEAVMGYFADQLGYGDDKAFWQTVGLLHDLDFEQYPEQHCVKEMAIMTELGLDPKLIHAVGSHGYGICCDIAPEHEMEKVLYATDELTGLIGAVIKMRPSKSTKDLELKSLKKKYKDKKFAAGCSRQVIEDGAKMLGWELDDLLTRTIEAMRQSEDWVIAETDRLTAQ
jgi:predicted hydrolase (HD superfamily)